MNARAETFKVFVSALVLLFASAVHAAPSGKWRIEMDGRAQQDGQIEFALTPKGATATHFVVQVPKGTSENAAARLIMAAIRKTFGKATYKTEIDDGEDVLVKARGGVPDFDLVVIGNSTQGLQANLDQE